MPNLGNVTEADGVSCPSATDCIAVGGHITVNGVPEPDCRFLERQHVDSPDRPRPGRLGIYGPVRRLLPVS
jgi:hypothetical protein